MGMTQKHYRMVADTMADSAYTFEQTFIATGQSVYQSQCAAIRTAAVQMIHSFKAENPRFDGERFINRFDERLARLNRSADLRLLLKNWEMLGKTPETSDALRDLAIELESIEARDAKEVAQWRK